MERMENDKIVHNKKELRRTIKQLKQNMSREEILIQANVVYAALEKNASFQKAEHILMYWAMADEMPTREFILKWYQHKKIYLPVVKGDDLEIFLFEGEASLVPGDKYGIPEPNGTKLSNEKIIDLVIVPGVAFDYYNNRMGRGAGYYDRILNRLKHSAKIGLAFDIQMMESIPVEAHDIPMDAVITAKK